MTDVFDRDQKREAEMLNAEPALVCECGEPIPEARRKALPEVTTCISCQQDIERRARCDWGSA